MELIVKQKNLPLGHSLREYVTGHMEASLHEFADRIRRVTVCLADINGPRGGVDKRCNIAVHLARGGTVRAGHTNTQFIAAIYFATDRAAQAIKRRLGRRRKRARQKRAWQLDAD